MSRMLVNTALKYTAVCMYVFHFLAEQLTVEGSRLIVRLKAGGLAFKKNPNYVHI